MKKSMLMLFTIIVVFLVIVHMFGDYDEKYFIKSYSISLFEIDSFSKSGNFYSIHEVKGIEKGNEKELIAGIQLKLGYASKRREGFGAYFGKPALGDKGPVDSILEIKVVDGTGRDISEYLEAGFLSDNFYLDSFQHFLPHNTNGVSGKTCLVGNNFSAVKDIMGMYNKSKWAFSELTNRCFFTINKKISGDLKDSISMKILLNKLIEH